MAVFLSAVSRCWSRCLFLVCLRRLNGPVVYDPIGCHFLFQILGRFCERRDAVTALSRASEVMHMKDFVSRLAFGSS
jgi:hypothetical protein